MDYDLLKIKSYQHWEVYLHENQCYIGRVFVLLKEESYGNADDFLGVGAEVREEFFQIGQEVKRALKTLFKPDRMNYAALSNTSEKIHVHLVPRYKDKREFAGVTFHDQRWGKNYAPYDRDFVLEEGVLFQIRDTLKEVLSNN